MFLYWVRSICYRDFSATEDNVEALSPCEGVQIFGGKKQIRYYITGSQCNSSSDTVKVAENYDHP